MDHLLTTLQGQLIVSCQPVIGGALDQPAIVAAFAQAAIDGGAKALRIEGIENVKAVRAITTYPIIGLVKRDLTDSDVRITPLLDDVLQLVAAGANIIAMDATLRPRPTPLPTLFSALKETDCLIMADCATLADAQHAITLGAHIVASTLSGYVGDHCSYDPDFSLVRSLSHCPAFVIAEGRIHSPQQAAQALQAGANAVVVGSAITRPEHITRWFCQAMGIHP